MTTIHVHHIGRSTVQDTPLSALSRQAIRVALDWRGPGTKPHQYWPDYQAMGDCAVCGHMRHDHPGEQQ